MLFYIYVGILLSAFGMYLKWFLYSLAFIHIIFLQISFYEYESKLRSDKTILELVIFDEYLMTENPNLKKITSYLNQQAPD